MLTLPSSRTLGALLIALPGLFATAEGWALTPAGSVIRNQASASFLDASGLQRTVTSNSVETLIQQVAGVTLTQDQNRLAAPGSQVVFPHVVTNTGNATDSFSLSAQNLTGDNFDYAAFAFYADADQNGVADNFIAINATPGLLANESFYTVLVVDVPVGVSAGDAAQVLLTATSNFDNSATDTDTDEATITAAAVLNVTKSISQLNGASPSGTYTVTLSYSNPSTQPATDVTLIDALPAGMTYVGGSGRWSETGATVLTDTVASDVQGSGSNTIVYCAYQSDCTGLAEATADADTISTNQVTAIVSQVGGGQSGSLEFQISIDSGLAAGALVNTAEFEFTDSSGGSGRHFTNAVNFTVDQLFAVVLNGSVSQPVDGAGEPVTLASVGQGQAANFENVVWNTGNGTDSFDLVIDTGSSTFPAGTVFQLMLVDGQTLLPDTNGNGIPDTGDLTAGADYRVMVKADIPSSAMGDNSGAGFSVSVSARSFGDVNETNTITNHLDEILVASVDLTNASAAGQPGAEGVGPGPETNPVTTDQLDPGGETEFQLFVNNTSLASDDYDLEVSTVSDFSTTGLPEGWTIQFRAASDDSPLLNTGAIAAGGSLAVIARIGVPGNQAPVTQSLYFRALSGTTGAVDIKHDAVVVRQVDALQLEPGMARQTEPGGFQIYPHLLSSSGNGDIVDIDLLVTNDLSANGWSATIYTDADDNGTLDPTDPAVDNIPLLASGATVRLFLKVYAPANESHAATNTSTLTVSWAGGSISIADLTTVTVGDMTILKEQAMDTGCDNVLDSAYSVTTFALPPGNNCVRYRLTATNTGAVPLYNALIQDATPAFTTYQPAALCSAAVCTIVEPAVGETGVITAEVSTLQPGESVELIFAVVLE
ncbi:MAG: hypothetical protein KTR33_08365 [Gammaproteobacteria bacterium]|nr:hypothetical protein [Gammaproteobacteria bacterium]